MKESIKVSAAEAAKIEEQTLQQSKSKKNKWQSEREWRLTASNFGAIMKLTDRRDMESFCESIHSPPNLSHVPATIDNKVPMAFPRKLHLANDLVEIFMVMLELQVIAHFLEKIKVFECISGNLAVPPLVAAFYLDDGIFTLDEGIRGSPKEGVTRINAQPTLNHSFPGDLCKRFKCYSLVGLTMPDTNLFRIL